MTSNRLPALSRRDLLRLGPSGAAVLGAAPLLSACADDTSPGAGATAATAPTAR
ncbi:hypothetical protein EDD29_6834 [Actinocorallia herbida]|uniref:Uncharacterized protein n=1 Tax=Actinocorallia herbida TaxID=58109 RepID=A0A3N1D6I9_9ACTN|nr:hypothetical protein [Actinocorallia herbida]ROO89147.1 hypothetical protein EDD29_6834 [Actinocorallia herbida]